MEKVSAFVTKNMALLVVVFAVVALIMPASFKWVVPQITLLLGVIMFGMGMTLRLQDFQEIFRRPRDVFIGVLAQFTIMPLLAYGLAKIFQLPPELAAGVILVGTCPGDTASNVMTYLAKGDLALSVSMTMTTTLLAPILLGIVINHFFGNFVKRVVKLLPLVSIVAILLIAGGVVSVNADKILQTGLLVMLVVVLHNLCGYGLGFCAAKVFNMNVAKAKAISIEVGMQNSGLAVSLAMIHFGAAAAIPGALFSVWHNISGSIAANWLAQKSNKDS